MERLQAEVTSHQTVHERLQDEVRRSKGALEAAQKSAVRAREEGKRQECERKKAEGERDQLRQR